MKILKFGGTSICDANQIKQISNIVRNTEKRILVFSAISGITNLLSDFIKQSKEENLKECLTTIQLIEGIHINIIDQLLSSSNFKIIAQKKLQTAISFINQSVSLAFSEKREKEILVQGELLSAMILYLYFLEQNIDIAYIPALSFMRINKTREPDYYYIETHLNKQLQKHHDCQCFITNGFICSNHENNTDNLGRGSSDLTATIIGSVLNAKKIEIWTDIDGLRNNDPTCIHNTSPITHLSYSEASELAFFGAKILHPLSIEPVVKQNIPIILKNSFNPLFPGTFISQHTKNSGIKGISVKDNITTIKVISPRMVQAYGILQKIFSVFEKYQTSVDMVTTSEISVAMTIDNFSHLSEIESELKEIGEVSVESNQSIVCIVGNFKEDKTSSVSKIFSVLDSIPVNLISFGASKINISFTINSQSKIEALQLLNDKILNNEPCLTLN
jgi:aspartate kinase